MSLSRLGLLLLSVLCVLWFVGAGCGMSSDYIKEEIKNAKACDTAEDCVSVGSKCPFGCSIVVNKTNADRIKSLVDGYSTNCQYDCLPSDKIVCEEGQCKQTFVDQ